MKKTVFLALLLSAIAIITKAEPINYLTFNGTNQCVSIPTTADLSMTYEESLSISFWVKSSATSNGRIISNRYNMLNTYGSLDYYFGGLMFVSDDTSNPLGIGLSDYGGGVINTWYHYVTVFNRTDSSVNVYQDGELIFSNDNLQESDVINTIANTTFGAGSTSSSYGNYLNGTIANVRFYKSALTADEVTTDMNTNSYEELTTPLKVSCVAAYDLTDNYTSLKVIDATGRGNDGSLINYVEPVEYLSFNGTDQYVSIPTTADLSMTSEESLSVSFWVKSPSSSSNRTICNRYNGGNSYGALDFYFGGFMLIGSSALSANVTMATNTWMHFVSVFDRTDNSAKIYKDGEVVISSTSLQTTDIINSPANTHFGAGFDSNGDASKFLQGYMANVRYYKSALTAEQVATDMLASSYDELTSELKSSCVASYNLTDNYNSLILIDETGNENNGELINYDYDINERTITVSASPSEGGVVSGGTTSNQNITITATANEGYRFVNWTLDGVEVSTDETYTDKTDGDKEYVANFTLNYCNTTEINNSAMSRYLTALTFEHEEYTQTLDVSQSAGDNVYCDKTASTISVVEGESFTLTADWTGSFMHGYLYIDLNNDGVFTPELGAYGVATSNSELLSFTYYQGYNSHGEMVATSGGLNNIPTFKIPIGIEEGTYTARFVIDWNSIDPCGKTTIGTNGGTMVDFKVEVSRGEYIGERTIKSESSDHNMGYTSGNETSEYIIELTATAYEGYEFVNWTLNNTIYSTSSTITDSTPGDKTYIANFQTDNDPRPANYLSFNGINQYVNIPAYEEMEMDEGESLSVSFWVRALNTSGGFPRVLCNRDNANEKYDGALDIYYDNLGCGLMFLADSLGTKTYVLGDYIGGSPGEWTHIALVFDRADGLATTYLNGDESVSGTLDAADILRSEMNTILGAKWLNTDTLGFFLEGDIANLRYYGSALTPIEIGEDMVTNGYNNLSDSLKEKCNLAYDLENLYPTLTLVDMTGKGNDATLVNYELPGELLVTEDKVEATNKRYTTITVEASEGEATKWYVSTNTIYSYTLNLSVCKDGTTPEINIVGDGVLVTDTTIVTHTIAGG